MSSSTLIFRSVPKTWDHDVNVLFLFYPFGAKKSINQSISQCPQLTVPGLENPDDVSHNHWPLGCSKACLPLCGISSESIKTWSDTILTRAKYILIQKSRWVSWKLHNWPSGRWEFECESCHLTLFFSVIRSWSDISRCVTITHLFTRSNTSKLYLVSRLSMET